MATLTRYPTTDAAVSGSWTTPENVQADDGAVAAITGASKNTTIGVREQGSFGFDAAIPVGSTINAVAIEVEHRVSTAASVAHLENQARIGSTAGATNTDSTEPTTLTARTYADYARPGGGAWTRDDLLDGTFTTRLVARQGNSTTSVTYEWDYIRVTVDYTPGATLHEVTVTDGIAMLDPAAKDEAHTRADALAVLGTYWHNADLNRTDGVCLDRADSHVALDLPRWTQDALLLRSLDARALDRLHRDLCLLAETVEALRESGSGTEVERSATDTLVFLDAAIRDVARLLADPTLLLSPPMTGRGLSFDPEALLLREPGMRKELLKAHLLTLLLRDAVTTEVEVVAAILRSVVDTLLLVDRRVSSLDRRIREPLLLADDELREAFHDLTLTDGVFVPDTRVSAVEKRLIETLLLLDAVSAEVVSPPVGGVFLRSVVDTLLMAGPAIREVAATQREALVLADATFRDLTLALLDRLAVRETPAAREMALGVTERLLLAESVTRLRELIAAEGLHVSDTALAQLFAVVVEALTFARLRAGDLLGMQVVAVGNWLGIRLGAVQMAGEA